MKVKKLSPRRVRIKCENCGEFNTTQRYEPMGCPVCGFPVKIVTVLPDSEQPARKKSA